MKKDELENSVKFITFINFKRQILNTNNIELSLSILRWSLPIAKVGEQNLSNFKSLY